LRPKLPREFDVRLRLLRVEVEIALANLIRAFGSDWKVEGEEERQWKERTNKAMKANSLQSDLLKDRES